MAHPKHDEVRQRYKGCCGFCQVSDQDAGGQFTVDHYLPAADGGDDSDENLVYCCFRCNLYKTDLSPTDKDRAAGRIVLLLGSLSFSCAHFVA